MGNDPTIFTAKALVIRAVLEQFSFHGCPSRRELEIQIAKLGRMQTALIKKYDPYSVHTPSEKKAFRRKVGPEIAKLDRQAKKMDELFLKMLEESYFSMPRPHLETRKKFRLTVASMSRDLERKIYQGVQQLQKEISGPPPRKNLKS